MFLKNMTKAKKHDLLIWLLLFLLTLSLAGVATAAVLGNDNIIYISFVDDLQQVWNYPDGHFVLAKQFLDVSFLDFKLSSHDRPFTGVFDGNGGVLGGLKLTSSSSGEETVYGLFGCNKGTIKNLGIQPASASSYSFADQNDSFFGFVAGENYGDISHCQIFPISTSSTFSIESQGRLYFGGVCGKSYGNVSDSYYRVPTSVSSDKSDIFVGGIIGNSMPGSTINECKFVSSLSVKSSQKAIAGGVAGHVDNSKVSNCYSGGTMNIESNESLGGGIVGLSSNSVTVSESYSQITINALNSADCYLGGFLGYSDSASSKLSNLLASNTFQNLPQNPKYGEIFSGNENQYFSSDNCYYLREDAGTTFKTGIQTSLDKLSLDLLKWDANVWNIGSSGVIFKPWN
jgi:hypothetical protein